MQVKSRHSYYQQFMEVNGKASNSSHFAFEERSPPTGTRHEED
jgi:hypothetical protein